MALRPQTAGGARSRRRRSFPAGGVPTGEGGGLLDPGGELGFVERVVFVNIEPAGIAGAWGVAGRGGVQGSTIEERHFYVAGQDVEGEEPALAFDAVEGRVPFDGFADVGEGFGDERIDAVAEFAFPAGHGGDVGLHGSVAVGFGDLGVTAGEEFGHRVRSSVPVICGVGRSGGGRRVRRGGCGEARR